MIRAIVATLALVCLSFTAQAASSLEDACWPLKLKGILIDVPSNVSAYDTAGIWVAECDKPTNGIHTYVLLFDWTEMKDVARRSWTKEAAKEYARTHPPSTTALTDAERAWRNQMYNLYKPVVVVAANNGQPRPVYKFNVDGSRAAQADPVLKVAAGTPCKAEQRVGTTNYFSVEGQKATNDTVLGRFVAQCFVSPSEIGIN